MLRRLRYRRCCIRNRSAGANRTCPRLRRRRPARCRSIARPRPSFSLSSAATGGRYLFASPFSVLAYHLNEAVSVSSCVLWWLFPAGPPVVLLDLESVGMAFLMLETFNPVVKELAVHHQALHPSNAIALHPLRPNDDLQDLRLNIASTGDGKGQGSCGRGKHQPTGQMTPKRLQPGIAGRARSRAGGSLRQLGHSSACRPGLPSISLDVARSKLPGSEGRHTRPPASWLSFNSTSLCARAATPSWPGRWE